MYFGDYLVLKKIINSDQLLKALCHQIENMPSMIRIVWEERIVNSIDLIELIKTQVKDDIDILVALKKNHKLTDEKIVELELIQNSRKIPLGEVLVKLNYVPPEVLNNSLKEFYENKFDIEHQESGSIQKEDDSLINEAALESLRELGMSLDNNPTGVAVKDSSKLESFQPRAFVEQYLELFNEKYKNKLSKLIDILEKEVETESDISNYFNSLYRDLHLLKGSITLSELQTQEEIISIWEGQIEKILTKNNGEIRQWCKKNLELLRKTIDILWKARFVIEQDKSDERLLTDENYKQEMSWILDKIS